MTRPVSPMISTDELAALLDREALKLVDGSWWLDGRDAHADYKAEHIEGAVFLDLEQISAPDSPLPHTLPSPAHFASVVGQAGIRRNDSIVVYDAQGLFSAARFWWMLTLYGASDVRILDGGLPKWKAEKRPTISGSAVMPDAVNFDAVFDPNLVSSLKDIKAALGSSAQIIDARGSARFNGSMPEPRAGVRSGHMPGALNLPFGQLLNPNGTIKNGPELEAAFLSVGLDMDRPVITTCGSGVTAAILTLGLTLLGKPSRLYDGSWSEWGSRADTPIQT